MNKSPDLKAEIKKTVAIEPIKMLLGALGTLVGTLVLAAIPQVRALIWPVIPKWLLLVSSVMFLSSVLVLVPYITHLRKKLRASEAERDALKSKPEYVFKFGIKWDDQLNPLCPHCESHLSGYHYIHISMGPDLSRFFCGGCGRAILMMNEDGDTIRFNDAREQMAARLIT